MLFTNITIKGNEYKLRLDARSSVSLERKLGKSPLDVLVEASEGSIPKLEDLIEIFAASLSKYNHGMTVEKAYDLYDDFLEDGNAFTDFIPVVIEIFKCSGYFKMEDNAEVADGVAEAGKN